MTLEYKPASDTQHCITHSFNTYHTTDDDGGGSDDDDDDDNNNNTVPYLRTLQSSLTQCSENLQSPCTN